MDTKNMAIGKKQNVDLLPTVWDIERFDFGPNHPVLTNAFQGLAWLQKYPHKTYGRATRTQLREQIYKMTGFMLPRGKTLLLPMDTPSDILRWLYVNALRYLDTNLLEEAYAEQVS